MAMDPLDVQGFDFYARDNSRDHHTERYDLVALRDKPTPIFRRGFSFIFTLRFNRNFDESRDIVYIAFSFGPKPHVTKGTKVILPLLTREKQMQKEMYRWNMTMQRHEGNTVTMQIHIPANAQAGIWRCEIQTEIFGGRPYEAYRRGELYIDGRENLKRDDFRCEEDIYILFNPWCRDDGVYMERDVERQEYVLNDSGKIWCGTYKHPKGKHWIFGQYDEIILPAVLFLLDKSQLPYADWGSPVLVSRAITQVVNAFDDEGLLEGKWDGDYRGGTSPHAWTGSIAILSQFLKSGGRPVKYGQCWIFSALVVTICRALGIPCRSTTNYVSAHDTNCSLTVDRYFDSRGNRLEYGPRGDMSRYKRVTPYHNPRVNDQERRIEIYDASKDPESQDSQWHRKDYSDNTDRLFRRYPWSRRNYYSREYMPYRYDGSCDYDGRRGSQDHDGRRGDDSHDKNRSYFDGKGHSDSRSYFDGTGPKTRSYFDGKGTHYNYSRWTQDTSKSCYETKDGESKSCGDAAVSCCKPKSCCDGKDNGTEYYNRSKGYMNGKSYNDGNKSYFDGYGYRNRSYYDNTGNDCNGNRDKWDGNRNHWDSNRNYWDNSRSYYGWNKSYNDGNWDYTRNWDRSNPYDVNRNYMDYFDRNRNIAGNPSFYAENYRDDNRYWERNMDYDGRSPWYNGNTGSFLEKDRHRYGRGYRNGNRSYHGRENKNSDERDGSKYRNRYWDGDHDMNGSRNYWDGGNIYRNYGDGGSWNRNYCDGRGGSRNYGDVGYSNRWDGDRYGGNYWEGNRYYHDGYGSNYDRHWSGSYQYPSRFRNRSWNRNYWDDDQSNNRYWGRSGWDGQSDYRSRQRNPESKRGNWYMDYWDRSRMDYNKWSRWDGDSNCDRNRYWSRHYGDGDRNWSYYGWGRGYTDGNKAYIDMDRRFDHDSVRYMGYNDNYRGKYNREGWDGYNRGGYNRDNRWDDRYGFDGYNRGFDGKYSNGFDYNYNKFSYEGRANGNRYYSRNYPEAYYDHNYNRDYRTYYDRSYYNRNHDTRYKNMDSSNFYNRNYYDHDYYNRRLYEGQDNRYDWRFNRDYHSPDYNRDYYNTCWTFHVWNEVWMARPDLPPGYGGWQVIDATPQEQKDTIVKCGPASVEAIRRGEVGFLYDTPFVFAEVNADLCHYQEDPRSEWGYSRLWLDRYQVGRRIVTKRVDVQDDTGENDLWDVTREYKNPEEADAERFAVYNAVRGVPRTHPMYELPDECVAQDVEFNLIDVDAVPVGQDFNILINICNNANEPRTINAMLSLYSVFYHGMTAGNIKRYQHTFNLKPRDKEVMKLHISSAEYLGKLVDHSIMKIYAIAHVKETNQTWSEEEDCSLVKPYLQIHTDQRWIVGQENRAEFSFRNPLNCRLTGCSYTVEGPGLQKTKVNHYRDVQPSEVVTFNENFFPYRAGDRRIVANFNCKEIDGINGSLTILVQ